MANDTALGRAGEYRLAFQQPGLDAPVHVTTDPIFDKQNAESVELRSPAVRRSRKRGMGRYAGRFHQFDRTVGDRVEARIALTTNPSPMIAVIEYRARWRGYAELAARERLNLSWILEAGATDPASLPPPAEIAASIAEELETALARFRAVAARLG